MFGYSFENIVKKRKMDLANIKNISILRALLTFKQASQSWKFQMQNEFIGEIFIE